MLYCLVTAGSSRWLVDHQSYSCASYSSHDTARVADADPKTA